MRCAKDARGLIAAHDDEKNTMVKNMPTLSAAKREGHILAAKKGTERKGGGELEGATCPDNTRGGHG